MIEKKNVLQQVAINSHLKSTCRSMLTSYLKYKVKTPGISTVSARYCVRPQDSIDIDYENFAWLSNSLRYYTCLKLWGVQYIKEFRNITEILLKVALNTTTLTLEVGGN